VSKASIVKIFLNGEEKWIKPTTTLSSVLSTFENPKLRIDANFYVAEFDYRIKLINFHLVYKIPNCQIFIL
jgi:hypothetical protein